MNPTIEDPENAVHYFFWVHWPADGSGAGIVLDNSFFADKWGDSPPSHVWMEITDVFSEAGVRDADFEYSNTKRVLPRDPNAGEDDHYLGGAGYLTPVEDNINSALTIAVWRGVPENSRIRISVYEGSDTTDTSKPIVDTGAYYQGLSEPRSFLDRQFADLNEEIDELQRNTQSGGDNVDMLPDPDTVEVGKIDNLQQDQVPERSHIRRLPNNIPHPTYDTSSNRYTGQYDADDQEYPEGRYEAKENKFRTHSGNPYAVAVHDFGTHQEGDVEHKGANHLGVVDPETPTIGKSVLNPDDGNPKIVRIGNKVIASFKEVLVANAEKGGDNEKMGRSEGAYRIRSHPRADPPLRLHLHGTGNDKAGTGDEFPSRPRPQSGSCLSDKDVRLVSRGLFQQRQQFRAGSVGFQGEDHLASLV